ncbi:MAG: hypothetical protein H5U19_08250 [Rhodobacteraceae bacterium]|nr:hypothetical protein [Paracoccaceae bacterium]
MTGTFDLDANLFMAVRRAVADDESSRIRLLGVLVEPRESGGAFLVATDGRVMLVGLDQSATATRPTILRLKMPQRELDEWGDEIEFTPWDRSRLHMEIDGQNAPSVAHFHNPSSRGYFHALVEEIEDAKHYPDWRAVMTGKVKVKQVQKPYNDFGINARILSRVQGTEPALHLEQPSEDGAPWRIGFERGDLTGVIMPRLMETMDNLALTTIHQDVKARGDG